MKARQKKQLSRRLKLEDGQYEAYLFSGNEVELFLERFPEKNKSKVLKQKKKGGKISSVSVIVDSSKTIKLGSVKSEYGVKISDGIMKKLKTEGPKRAVKAAKKIYAKSSSISTVPFTSNKNGETVYVEKIEVVNKKPVSFGVKSIDKSGKTISRIKVYDSRLGTQNHVLNPDAFSIVVDPPIPKPDDIPKR